MDHHPERWGKPRSDYNSQTRTANNVHGAHGLASPISHTQQPVITGTSVLAIRYRDGVMMAADCLASYGSLARFRDQQRMVQLGESTLMGTSGDISDLQFTINMLKRYMIEEFCWNDGHRMSPSQWHTALTAYMYARRSKMNPLWNSHIIAGVDQKSGQPFLGFADLLGTTFQSSTIATGFGAYLAQPMLREAVEGKEDALTEEEARNLLEGCMKILWYRDARSTDLIQIAKVTRTGVQITSPYQLQAQEWSVANYKFQN